MTDTLALGVYPDPDWGYEFTVQPRISYIQYGDGYKGRVPDGMNSILRKTTLTYSHLYDYEMELLKKFLEAQNGVNSFYWTPFGEDTVGVWLAPKWTISPNGGQRWKVTIDIEETPDLDSL